MKNKISIRRLILMSLCTLNASHHLLQAKLSPQQENTFRKNAVKALNEGNANEVQAIIKKLSSLGEVALANEILQLAQQKGFSTQDSSANKGFGKGNVSENVITDQALLTAYENAIKLLDDETIKNWKGILQGIIANGAIDDKDQAWIDYIFDNKQDFIKLIDPKNASLLNQLSAILETQLNAKNTQSSDQDSSTNKGFGKGNASENVITNKALITAYENAIKLLDEKNAKNWKLILQGIIANGAIDTNAQGWIEYIFAGNQDFIKLIDPKNVVLLNQLSTILDAQLNAKNTHQYSEDLFSSVNIAVLKKRYNEALNNAGLEKKTLEEIIALIEGMRNGQVLNERQVQLVNWIFPQEIQKNAFLMLANKNAQLLNELYIQAKLLWHKLYLDVNTDYARTQELYGPISKFLIC